MPILRRFLLLLMLSLPIFIQAQNSNTETSEKRGLSSYEEPKSIHRVTHSLYLTNQI